MLSLIIICQQVDELLTRTLKSCEYLGAQVLIGYAGTDTISLGERKNVLIEQAANDWILLLDTDEVISPQLSKEIEEIMMKSPDDINGYLIPYENYAFGKPVKFGGERYSKVRLFRKLYGSVVKVPVHEEIIIKGNVGKLTGIIRHYSYRSLDQVFTKFTKYAWQMAGEKFKAREKVTLKKLFLYGPHMVWARVIKDEGWRDGWRGILIALCFGYMESLMYWLLLYRYIIG